MTSSAAAKPHPVRRLFAAAIDVLLAAGLYLVPGVGGVLAMVYILTRDALLFTVTRSEANRNMSLGKKLAGLKLIADGDEPVGIRVSIKRNLSLVLGVLFGVFVSPAYNLLDMGFGEAVIEGPVILVVLAAGVLPILGETVLALTDKDGRRWGDHFSRTRLTHG